MPRIAFVCQLRFWTRLEGVEVDALTIREALLQLARVPGLPAGFIDADGRLTSSWCPVVDGEQIDDAIASTRTLRPDSELMPVPKPVLLDREGVRALLHRSIHAARHQSAPPQRTDES